MSVCPCEDMCASLYVCILWGGGGLFADSQWSPSGASLGLSGGVVLFNACLFLLSWLWNHASAPLLADASFHLCGPVLIHLLSLAAFLAPLALIAFWLRHPHQSHAHAPAQPVRTRRARSSRRQQKQQQQGHAHEHVKFSPAQRVLLTVSVTSLSLLVHLMLVSLNVDLVWSTLFTPPHLYEPFVLSANASSLLSLSAPVFTSSLHVSAASASVPSFSPQSMCPLHADTTLLWLAPPTLRLYVERLCRSIAQRCACHPCAHARRTTGFFVGRSLDRQAKGVLHPLLRSHNPLPRG